MTFSDAILYVLGNWWWLILIVLFIVCLPTRNEIDL